MIPLDEQLRLLDSAWPRNWLRASARISSHSHRLHALMLKRAANLGVDTYGDASFRKSKAELIRECDEELADALMYDALIELHEAGVLG
jgi:hypothetical protein